MALFKFTKAIFENKPLEVYNHGKHSRDFTYVEDIVESIENLIDKPPEKNNQKFDYENPTASESFSPYSIYNIGSSETISLMDFIKLIEKATKKQARIKFLDFQLGDVEKSFSDTSKLEKKIGFKPSTSLESGINKFVAWYKDYYKI
jgi:UDP-glucuronate 4-epimerase